MSVPNPLSSGCEKLSTAPNDWSPSPPMGSRQVSANLAAGGHPDARPDEDLRGLVRVASSLCRRPRSSPADHTVPPPPRSPIPAHRDRAAPRSPPGCSQAPAGTASSSESSRGAAGRASTSPCPIAGPVARTTANRTHRTSARSPPCRARGWPLPPSRGRVEEGTLALAEAAWPARPGGHPRSVPTGVAPNKACPCAASRWVGEARRPAAARPRAGGLPCCAPVQGACPRSFLRMARRLRAPPALPCTGRCRRRPRRPPRRPGPHDRVPRTDRSRSYIRRRDSHAWEIQDDRHTKPAPGSLQEGRAVRGGSPPIGGGDRCDRSRRAGRGSEAANAAPRRRRGQTAGGPGAQPKPLALLPPDLHERRPARPQAHHVDDLLDAPDLRPCDTPYEDHGRRNAPHAPATITHAAPRQPDRIRPAGRSGRGQGLPGSVRRHFARPGPGSCGTGCQPPRPR